MIRALLILVLLLFLPQCKTVFYGVENRTASDLYIDVDFYHVLSDYQYRYSIDTYIDIIEYASKEPSEVRRISIDTINHIGTYILPPNNAFIFNMIFDNEENDYDFTSVVITDGKDSIFFNSPNELEEKLEKQWYGSYSFRIYDLINEK